MTWRDMGSKNYGANLTVISGPKHTGYTQVFLFRCLFGFFWTTWYYLETGLLKKSKTNNNNDSNKKIQTKLPTWAKSRYLVSPETSVWQPWVLKCSLSASCWRCAMSTTFIRAYCVPIFHSPHDSLLPTLRPNISCHLPCFLGCYFQIVKLKNKIYSLYPCFHLKNTGLAWWSSG